MADWHTTAAALKAEGLSNAEIGRRVGKDRRTVSDLFRMPPCPSCGTPMTLTGSAQCKACDTRARRQAADERLDDIAQMYEAGMSRREIARALGWGPNSDPGQLTALHRSGRIGYRYAAYETKAAA